MTAVLLTRPDGEADPVVAALVAAGYRVHAVPTVATQALEFDPPDLARYDWAVVTSAAGVHALLPSPLPGAISKSDPARAAAQGQDEGLKVLSPHWAAVGPATARALRAVGVEPSLVPNESNGLALANALPGVRGKRVLLVRASAASADLPERLRERGATVDELAAYLTIEGPASSSEALKAALSDVELAVIVFASGSAARGYVALGGSTSWPAVTIGPRTTEVARRLGLRVVAEAERQSVESLAAAVVRAIPIKERNRA
ncbi:MAG TPA: uroporphyrinogen-III synthase [Candidatus Dormibacteraeota bacterium]|nr:uroporphyrinogen-III synthase [Candidatus Dormibacteraeota bacterium]